MAPFASENKLKLRWLVAELNSYFASCEQQEDLIHPNATERAV